MTTSRTLKSLVINSPYTYPQRLWRSLKCRHTPSFLTKLNTKIPPILKINSEQAKAKRVTLDTWVTAINNKGGFGEWCVDVIFEPAHIQDVLKNHADYS